MAEFGEPRWDALLAALPGETATLIREADINEWYPETKLRRLIHRIYVELAERDDERFVEIARGLALAGIGRFFRVLINFASARFVLRKLPVPKAEVLRHDRLSMTLAFTLTSADE